MRNKFLETGEQGYHPIRKLGIILSGLKYAIRYDFSVTYKLFLSVAVLLFFFFFRQWVDFLLLAAATTMMLQAELFNSAIEAICDFLTQEENRKMVHPTKAYFVSCSPRIFSLKKSISRNPYACFCKVFILLFVPSRGPVDIGKSK